MRIYVYKCVVDDGGAPCVDDGLLTLTICKPYIRSTARKGDLIFAFGSNSERQVPANRLVYIAEVGRPSLRKGTYFRNPAFMRRQDCIYEWVDGGLEWKEGADFHARGLGKRSDLGPAPRYRKANALVCDDFRYFGRAGDDAWKREAPTLARLVELLGQGHRVNFTVALELELLALKDAVWREHPGRKVLGPPLHAPGTRVTDQGEEASLVEIVRPRCRTHCDEPEKKCRPASRRC